MELNEQVENAASGQPAGSQDAPAGSGPGGPPVRKALGRLLEESGLLTHEQVRQAAEEAARRGERFGEVLVRQGRVQERDIARLMAEQWEIPFVEHPVVAPSAAGLLAPASAREAAALPLSVESGRALVAVAEPSTEHFARVRSLLPGHEVDFAVVTQTALAANLPGVEAAKPETPAPGAGLAAVAAPTTPSASLAEAGVAEPEAPAPTPALEGLVADIERAKESLLEAAATLDRVGDALKQAAREQTAALTATERKLDELERRLADVLAAQEQERARAAELEAELAKRNDLFTELRTKLSDLTGALEGSGSHPATP